MREVLIATIFLSCLGGMMGAAAWITKDGKVVSYVEAVVGTLLCGYIITAMLRGAL